MFCFHKMSKFRIMNVKTNPHFRNSIIIHVILIEPFWDKSVNPTRRNTTGSSCYKNKINLNARNGNHFTVIITKKAIPQLLACCGRAVWCIELNFWWANYRSVDLNNLKSFANVVYAFFAHPCFSLKTCT